MTSKVLAGVFRRVGPVLRPPEQLSFSNWSIENFRLVGDGAPERFRPWKFQVGILDAMGDPLIERVSVIKAARTGYTKSLVSTIGAFAANDPTSMILLMPTDDDARGIVVDEIDPAFRQIKALKGLMVQGRMDGRNTLTSRKMKGGGSLKVLSAAAPRKLRRHTARVAAADEVDGMEITAEGDPLKLFEKRTLSKADRKIITGSTPTDDVSSIIVKRYGDSDQRIFEVPCPFCEVVFEILWDHISWPKGEPEKAVCNCPNCGTEIEETYKAGMVAAGEWRATKPEVKGHAGFRLNSLISLFENAGWGKLAAEFIEAQKNGHADMQVFVNTVLGQVWSSTRNRVTEEQLMGRVEAFGIEWDDANDCWREDMPSEVAYITVGIDVQVDRLECTLVGWDGTQRIILGHYVIMGPPNLQSTWDECDGFLRTRWRHPLGGTIGIEAAAIDAGDGNMTQYVYDFTATKLDRKVVAIKGVGGSRAIIAISRSKNKRFKGATFFNIGVDQVKADIAISLPMGRTMENGEKRPQAFRFSETLSEEWFRQLNSEPQKLRYVSGRPVVSFDRIENRQAEALDTVVYAIAVKSLCKFDYDARRIELMGTPAAKAKPDFKAIASRLNG